MKELEKLGNCSLITWVKMALEGQLLRMLILLHLTKKNTKQSKSVTMQLRNFNSTLSSAVNRWTDL